MTTDLIQLSQYKADIVAPALEILASALPRLYSPWAVNQLTGTALVESGLLYVEQLGAGPALGLDQMEPATFTDCFTNFLDFPAQAGLRKLICAMAGSDTPTPQIMVGNATFACAMARIKYWRSPLSAPAFNDALGCATYWKKVYNSDLGAGAVDTNHINLFQLAVNA